MTKREFKPNSPHRGRDFDEVIQEKRIKRMGLVDEFSPEIRALVHCYGLRVVKTLLDHHVTKPRAIKDVVETILDEFSPTRGSYSIQGLRKEIDK